jgi:hypothetical protein
MSDANLQANDGPVEGTARIMTQPAEPAWKDTRAAFKRLNIACRWLAIEILLDWVGRLIRPTDPGALPLLIALSHHYGPGSDNEQNPS